MCLTDTTRTFSTTNALNIAGSAGAWTGLLDVDETGITVNGASDATIRDEIIEGRSGGSWSGAGGITSTAAHNNAALAVGYLDTGSGVKIACTVLGDANMDGTVSLADLNILLNNYGRTSATWGMGDFNYDGTVSLADLNLLLNNYGRTFAGDTVSGGANLDAAAIGALRADGITVVPEPGALALLAAGLVGLLAYAWRKRN